MRKIVAILAVSMLTLATVPAYSQQTQAEKDECLLAAQNCSSAVDDIQNRIKRLRAEINKGTRVYTPQELNALKAKLRAVTELMNQMQVGP